jgi:hypothetical protein
LVEAGDWSAWFEFKKIISLAKRPSGLGKEGVSPEPYGAPLKGKLLVYPVNIIQD